MSENDDTPTPVLGEPPGSSLADNDPKTIADRYTIVDRLGEGGMGRIYLAIDPVLSRKVAIKVLPFLDHNTEHYQRFQQEARAVSKLKHPGIVLALDFGLTEEQEPFLVMDYVDGLPLSQYLRQTGPLDIDSFKELFLPICRAMQHAHNQNIIHRDLKPSNIMVKTEDGQAIPFVLDFGVAKILHESGSLSKTQAGQVVGSPKYLSPEQASGRPVDNRTDIYSLGCVMFEALAGSAPFRGDTAVDTIRKHREMQPPSLSSQSGRVFSEDIEFLIRKTLAKTPKERYQSMKELADAIEKLQIIEPPEIERHTTPAEEIEEEEEKQELKFGLKRESNLGRFSLIAILSGSLIAALFFFLRLAPDLHQDKSESLVDNSFKKDYFKYLMSVPKNAPGRHLQRLRSGVYDGHPRLPALVLYGTEVTDSDLVNLKAFYEATDVDLSSTDVTNKAIPHIASCPWITKLKLTDTRVRGKSLQLLARLPELETLNLNNCKLADSDLLYISRIKSLKRLLLDGNKQITDTGLAYLAGLPNLSTLSLNGSSITPGGLKAFKRSEKLDLFVDKCRAFKGIDLKQLSKNTGISVAYSDRGVLDDLNSIEKSLKAGLRIVPLPSGGKAAQTTREFMDDDFKQLQSEPGVTKLIVIHEVIDGSGFRFLTKLPLREINLTGCKNLDEKNLELLSNIKTLRVLDLSKTNLTDAGVAYLQSIPALEILCVDRTAVTQAGLMALAGKKSLRIIVDPSFKSSDIGKLAKRLRVRDIVIRRTNSRRQIIQPPDLVKDLGL